jgi:acyl-coenzyme A synthetase/AMP-(fatty) acid ligase
MTTVLSPILPPAAQNRPVIWHEGTAVSQGGLLQSALQLAERLPDRAYVINACATRFGFLQALLAALMRNQVTVLPNDRSPGMMAKLTADFPDIYCLYDDGGAPFEGIASHHVPLEAPTAIPEVSPPEIDMGREALVVFTSGSTGAPMPHKKTPGLLATTGQLIAARFRLNEPAPASVVATVPSQHMYGLETSVALPLWGGPSVHSAKPFYPADIAAALAELPAPRVLVTTPVHLNALVKAAAALPPLHKVISATAPLSLELAADVERRYSTTVCEIFGFSEAGTVATRRTLDGPVWRTCDGLSLRQDADGCMIDAPHFPEAVPVNDIIEVLSANTFTLRGRPTDTINIAGKRASLSGLNSILTALPGVRDGAFSLGAGPADKVARLVAFVVSESLTAEDLRAALRREVDPAFLPRHIHFVSALPRAETGKLPQSALEALAASLTSTEP